MTQLNVHDLKLLLCLDCYCLEVQYCTGNFTKSIYLPCISVSKNNIDLTMNNFTWIKEPLGVDEKYELIRNASATKTQVILVFIHVFKEIDRR